MNKLKAIPAIRFKGFTDDWERRKVTDLLKTTKGSMKIGPFGSALKKEYYVNTGVKVYAQENIFEEDFTIGDYYITPAKYEELKSCELRPGDLVISMMGTIGACAIFPSNAEKGIMNSHLLRLQFKDGIIPEFIKLLLQDSELIKNQINRLSVGSIMNGLSSSVVQKLVFPMTSIDEQKRIVHFFGLLNHIIILHQRKLELQKRIKEYFLQNMFPAKGENVPKLRFKGFTDAWKHCKLDNLCELITKQTGFDYSKTIKPMLVRKKETDTYPFIQNKDFTGNKINLNTDFYIPIKIAEKFPKITLDKPSILISISGRIGNVGFYKLKEKSFIGGAVGICKLKNENDGEFILQELESEYGQYYFKSLIKASSHANITVEDIRNIELIMPTSREENAKISTFLLKIDRLITIHQRKIEQLQSIKKFMLQNMFC
ncbi:MAG: restriction endonuclease subunit S [Acidaminococcus sp.]|jgi:type I restriction enzyme S subunit|nr:restriction endonuclease subunit S [Acidaminococcus sp.]MCI2099713.1 restriction endonuclease subunit S [Acidaminococcus sp.]MCI2113882.1 restriction endonuclease subunit S [Acidaminococcus sp.]MCI2115882.1 restriction endonuclease subunit S [Acidaminococcus sp.]